MRYTYVIFWHISYATSSYTPTPKCVGVSVCVCVQISERSFKSVSSIWKEFSRCSRIFFIFFPIFFSLFFFLGNYSNNSKRQRRAEICSQSGSRRQCERERGQGTTNAHVRTFSSTVRRKLWEQSKRNERNWAKLNEMQNWTKHFACAKLELLLLLICRKLLWLCNCKTTVTVPVSVPVPHSPIPVLG